jgi:hypothetical protein
VSSKEFMIEVLKKSCGGSCLTDPENCGCFGIPSKELIDELGIDFEEGDDFYKAEDCPHYDAEAWAYSEDEELYNNTGSLDYKPLGFFELFENLGKETRLFSKKANQEIKKEEKKDVQNVYLMITSYGIKIGKSRTPVTRAKTLGTKLPFKIKEMKVYPVEDMTKTELFLHGEYKDYRLNGEWFNLSNRQITEIDEYLNKIKH